MNVWVDIASIVASLATFGALVAVLFEVKSSRDAEKRQAAFGLDSKFSNLLSEVQIVDTMTWESADDFDKKYEKYLEGTKAYYKLGNFFDTIGEAVFNGLLDREMTIMTFGVMAISYWRKFRDVASKYRVEKGLEVDWLYFEWFALLAKKESPNVGKHLRVKTAELRMEVDM